MATVASFTFGLSAVIVNICKNTYQFETLCKDDVMISVH